MNSTFECGVMMQGLEVRALLSGDVAVNYPLGVFNATPSSSLPPITVEASAEGADGKIVFAGETVSPQASTQDEKARHLIVMRYNADGTIDSTFGTGGYSIFDFREGDHANVQNVAVQPDGGIVVASQFRDFARLNADGSVDTTFGNPGISKDGDPSKTVLDMIGETNGDLVVAFRTKHNNVRVMRYTAEGQVDGTFNQDHGDIRINIVFRATGFQLTQLPNGKILVLQDGGEITRLKKDGTTDVDFGDHGLVQSDNWAWLAPTTGGKFLAVLDGDNEFQRINADGQIDIEFGEDGAVTAAGGPVVGVATIANGEIVAFSDSSKGLAETRFEPNGTIDASFGSKGVKYFHFSSRDVGQILSEADGGFFTAGVSKDAEGGSLGAQLLHFDSGGGLTQILGSVAPGESGKINAMDLLSDNSVLAAGFENAVTGQDFYLAKFTQDGKLDPSFGGGAGWTSVDLGNADDQAVAMDVGPDGKIGLGGISGGQIAVAVFNSDGSPDESFGDHGHEIYSFQANGLVKALKFQSDGKIVLAVNGGTQIYSQPEGFTVARIDADGTLDRSFNSSGYYTAPSSLKEASVYDLAIDHQGRIVAAGVYESANDALTNLAIRLTTSGTLDTGFNSTGIFHYHTTGDTINSILVLPNDAILASSYVAMNSSVAGSVFEISSNGVLYSKLPGAASNSEIVPTVNGHSLPINMKLAQDSEGRIIFYGESSYQYIEESSGDFYFGETIDVMRFTSGLEPDTSFGTNGATEFGLPKHDGVTSAVAMTDGSVVMGTSFGNGQGPLFHLSPDAGASSGVTVSGKTLRIVGASGNDQITIKRAGSRIRVSVDGNVTYFSRKKVSRIAATLLGGDDFLSIGADLPYATIFGGAGNDTLSSVDARDSLIGGLGVNQIDGVSEQDQPSS